MKMPLAAQQRFVYHQSMKVEVERADDRASAIAATMGEPARARMLFCLMDGRARTSTELAVVAGVSPSTASVHLQRLKALDLVSMTAQGKHRYFRLTGPRVAAALEALSVLAGGPRDDFAPTTPHRLRFARSCYDHMAGALGVTLNDRLRALGWVAAAGDDYRVTPKGLAGLSSLGVEVEAARAQRRRFAFGCLDWSERRPHLGGALGAALLNVALERRWVERDPDDRALSLTDSGRRALRERLQISLEEPAADPSVRRRPRA
jgi:DNA-binding transcriptional ArsR family regulator